MLTRFFTKWGIKILTKNSNRPIFLRSLANTQINMRSHQSPLSPLSSIWKLVTRCRKLLEHQVSAYRSPESHLHSLSSHSMKTSAKGELEKYLQLLSIRFTPSYFAEKWRADAFIMNKSRSFCWWLHLFFDLRIVFSWNPNI